MYKSVANASTVASGNGAPVVEPRSTDSEATKVSGWAVGKSCRLGLSSKHEDDAVAGVELLFVADALVENVALRVHTVEEEDDDEKARLTAWLVEEPRYRKHVLIRSIPNFTRIGDVTLKVLQDE